MINWKLRAILRKVKNKNPQKRYEALSQLYHYKQDENIQVDVDILKDMIKTAASKFPTPVANWDCPSFYLIDFVCDFPMREVIDGLMKHFDAFDSRTKERVIPYLIATEEEPIFYFLEDQIVRLLETNSFQIPVHALSPYPILMKGIINRSLGQLALDQHKIPLYQLILQYNLSGHDHGYLKEAIMPILLDDYFALKEKYIKYDKDYSTKFVYTAWKENYAVTRNQMGLFIQLMAFYFTTETEQEIKEAVQFNDPFIKTDALIICMTKNLPYEQHSIVECANELESAEMFYWKLVEKNLTHLYPFEGNKQHHFAKSRLFFTVTNLSNDERSFYPEQIEVVDQLEVKSPYGHPHRFYLMRFSESGTIYAGWVGGFTFEDGDDTANMTHDSYTQFVEFDAMSIEAHKQAFLEKDVQEKQDYGNFVFYEGSPKINNFAWFLLFPLGANWLQGPFDNIDALLFSIGATVLLAAFFAYEIRNSKRQKIIIRSQQLIKQDGKTHQEVDMQDIKKIERNKQQILVYNQNDELVFKIPLRWVHYELFSQHMRKHTAHLHRPPYIQS